MKRREKTNKHEQGDKIMMEDDEHGVVNNDNM